MSLLMCCQWPWSDTLSRGADQLSGLDLKRIKPYNVAHIILFLDRETSAIPSRNALITPLMPNIAEKHPHFDFFRGPQPNMHAQLCLVRSEHAQKRQILVVFFRT